MACPGYVEVLENMVTMCTDKDFVFFILGDTPPALPPDGTSISNWAENEYDVIIVDCSDPIGPGEGLFTHAFYQNVYKALKPDGLFVQQTESPFYHQPLIRRLSKDIKNIFPIHEMYLAHIPIYPGGMHCFTIGSKKYASKDVNLSNRQKLETKYYNQELQKAAFALPNFVKELIK